MLISWALMAALNTQALPLTVEFIDSRDDNKATYAIVKHDNKTCKVRLDKSELRDYDKAIAIIMEMCDGYFKDVGGL